MDNRLTTICRVLASASIDNYLGWAAFMRLGQRINGTVNSVYKELIDGINIKMSVKDLAYNITRASILGYWDVVRGTIRPLDTEPRFLQAVKVTTNVLWCEINKTTKQRQEMTN